VGEVDHDTQSMLDIWNNIAQNRSDESIRAGMAQVDKLLHNEANPS
jgi:hypothetical protein